MKFRIKKDKDTSKELSKIEKAKKIIKQQKATIKEARKKLKEKNNINKEDKKQLKSQIFNAIYYQLMGALMCLIVLYFLSGGKNYIKLYKELNKLIDTYDAITTSYYGKVDKEKIINSAISSMVSSVDDGFTTYSDEEKTESFMETVGGVYEGIGASVSKDEKGNIVIVEIFDNSPAKKAGLKEKDIVLKIDDKNFENKSITDMAEYVKNSKNKTIKLTIKRGEEEKDIIIKREKINVPTISSKIIEQDNKKIGYINISIFSSVTTTQFKKELKKLEKKKIEALIIDVRNNNGGYLTTATDISSMFLKKGKIIYRLSSKNKTIKEKDKTTEHREYPIAVLTNKYSASASEILAAAIKESYNGHIVGTTTYGKGTVQKAKKLKDGTMIKYTVQKWLTPKGNWIDKKGVTPTEKVELKSLTKDEQLEKATELLIKDLTK
ncbi:MAG: S41 family peptidase [Bacilli bacterium]|nr:S41 family peptidase [Bacilli bacterium]